jgi:HD-GYP domain-containing protein (c-di-GMP phosphodiesterase class II)
MTQEKAIAILVENAGIQFDPDVVAMFISLPRGVLAVHTNADQLEPAVAGVSQ